MNHSNLYLIKNSFFVTNVLESEYWKLKFTTKLTHLSTLFAVDHENGRPHIQSGWPEIAPFPPVCTLILDSQLMETTAT